MKIRLRAFRNAPGLPQQLRKIPNVIGKPRGHCRCHTQRLMNPAEVIEGEPRIGGTKGVAARMDKVSPERRKEIAQKAIAARWAKRVIT